MSAALPSLAQLQKYNVNRPGQVEGIRQSLYDFQTYAQAGQTSLRFFQVPIGQSSKTKSDTNMTTAGSLPAPQNFLIEGIEIHFFPLNVVSATGAIVAANLNDAYAVSKAGYMELTIGSKVYLTEAPLGRMPPSVGLAGIEAISDTTTAAASRVTVVDYARFGGQPYKLDPPILLIPTQNFDVTLYWPTAVSVTVAARIGVVLRGIMYRNSQ